MRYYLEFGLYYFIALLFGIAFTIDEQLRPARKILLPLTLATLVYELSTHWYPHTTTLIDLIDNKMPLFVQGKILRRTLALLIALIRSYYAKMPSEEKKLL